MKIPYESYSCQLRTMTLRSVFDFGRDYQKGLSVQEIINLEKTSLILNAYYRLDKISFTDDVLLMVGITEELRIKKPGKLREEEAGKYVKNAQSNYFERVDKLTSEYMQIRRISEVKKTKKFKAISNKIKENIIFSKNMMLARNHGHRTKDL